MQIPISAQRLTQAVSLLLSGEERKFIMSAMVQCSWCHSTYDLTRVTVIARYSDCTVFESPCCHRQVDDRSWKSMPDFQEVKQANNGLHSDGFLRGLSERDIEKLEVLQKIGRGTYRRR